tara:strand:+ start:786 stop:1610 length:825 start_codon:yes stop_codon:yes gene_type:complete
MAARTIATTDTLETFRQQFNLLSSSDFGDIATLNAGISATSVIGAVNELYSSIAGSLAFTVTDGSNSQTIGNAQTLTFTSTANQVTATVSATDTVTLALASNLSVSGTSHTFGTLQISGNALNSSNADTITVNDKLAITNTNTLTLGGTDGTHIESSEGSVRFGSSNIVTGGFIYTRSSTGFVLEGSTEDNFETIITATDPTADRTVTLPNASGTVILTGSTGVVSGTMMAADTVAESNMADDAIGQDQLKQVVNLQIINSSGTVVKTLFGAGA